MPRPSQVVRKRVITLSSHTYAGHACARGRRRVGGSVRLAGRPLVEHAPAFGRSCGIWTPVPRPAAGQLDDNPTRGVEKFGHVRPISFPLILRVSRGSING